MEQLSKPLNELATKLEESDYLEGFGAEKIPFHLRDSISFHELPLWAAALSHIQGLERDLESKQKVMDELRPVWAQGYTSDSMAAQASANALAQLWALLGVTSQTEAVMKLKGLRELAEGLASPLEVDTSHSQIPRFTAQTS